MGAITGTSSSAAREVAAEEGSSIDGEEELLGAFESIKGPDGLLGLDGFRDQPDVRALLDNGLLRDTEVVEIWESVTKADVLNDRVDFIGFSEAFTRVDTLFEEEDEEEDEEADGALSSAGAVLERAVGEDGGDGRIDERGPRSAAEDSFVQLVGSTEGLLDFEGLLRWNEVTELIEEGLLAPKEVETIWERLPKILVTKEESGETSTSSIDVQGFAEFDRQLNDLFEDEDDETIVQGTAPAASMASSASPVTSSQTTSSDTVSVMVTEQGKAPGQNETGDGPEQRTQIEQQFLQLSSTSGGRLDVDGLKRWSEVSELLEEGLVSLEEVEQIWESLPKVDGGDSIDLTGFARFAQQLDSMFETVEEDSTGPSSQGSSPSPNSGGSSPSGSPQGVEDASSGAPPSTASKAREAGSSRPTPEASVSSAGSGDSPKTAAAAAKRRVLDLAKAEIEDCGMGCGEDKRAQVLKAVEDLLLLQEGNMILNADLGEDLVKALVGEWRLLYTSSNAIEYNQGLTGLANTLPNARFRGLRQLLHADGMVFDAEYEEELTIRDEAEPLIITVASDWEVKQTSSLVTGKSSVAVKVAPKQIKYGFITVHAERWKTLRAMTLLDVAYLDEDVRIMRGQTARQNLFVFLRC